MSSHQQRNTWELIDPKEVKYGTYDTFMQYVTCPYRTSSLHLTVDTQTVWSDTGGGWLHPSNVVAEYTVTMTPNMNRDGDGMHDIGNLKLVHFNAKVGCATADFDNDFRLIIQGLHPDVMLITETGLSDELSREIIPNLGFRGHRYWVRDEFYNGMFLLWNQRLLNMNFEETYEGRLSVTINRKLG